VSVQDLQDWTLVPNSTGRPSIPLAGVGRGVLLYHSVSSRRLHNKLTHTRSNRKKIASHYRRLRHYMQIYVIILAVDGGWLWKRSHFFQPKQNTALHRNRKWRPACQDESQQQQQQPWRLAYCGCLWPISGHHLHAGWPQWPTDDELGRHTTPC